jgi:hypothetical protein
VNAPVAAAHTARAAGEQEAETGSGAQGRVLAGNDLSLIKNATVLRERPSRVELHAFQRLRCRCGVDCNGGRLEDSSVHENDAPGEVAAETSHEGRTAIAPRPPVGRRSRARAWPASTPEPRRPLIYVAAEYESVQRWPGVLSAPSHSSGGCQDDRIAAGKDLESATKRSGRRSEKVARSYIERATRHGRGAGEGLH